MSNARADLEIYIRTMADAQGLQLTEEQLQRVTNKLEGMEAATIQSTGATAAEKEALQARAQAALRSIDATEQSTAAAGRAAGGARELSHELRGMKEAGHGAEMMFEGLRNGSPLEVLRGSSMVAKGLAGSLELVGGALARVSVVAAPAAVAIAAMNEVAKNNEKEIERIYDTHAKNIERAKAAAEANKVAVEKLFQSELQWVEKLTTAYANLTAEMDKASKRFTALRKLESEKENATAELDEEKALEKARSPEERAAIKKKFENQRTSREVRQKYAELTAEELDAKTREESARQAIGSSQAERDSISLMVRDQEAKTAALGDRAKSIGAKFGMGTAAHEAALGDWKASDSELKKMREKQGEVNDRTGKIDKVAQEQIDAAKQTLEEAGKRRQYYELSIEVAKEKLKTPSGDTSKMTPAEIAQDAQDRKDKIKAYADPQAEEKAKNAPNPHPVIPPTVSIKGGGSGGTMTRGDMTIAVTDARSAERAMANAHKESSATNAVIVSAMKATADETKKLRQQITMMREATPGGG